jgi:hypothetical protein
MAERDPRVPEREATMPRTIAGQAALSTLRPQLRQALAPTIVSIEVQAVEPYVAALRDADQVLATVAALDASTPLDDAVRAELVVQAGSVHRQLAALLEQ